MARPATTLAELLEERVKKDPRKLLLLFDNRGLSYADFQREVHRAANAFLRAGVKRGDKLALFLPNCPEFLVIVFAAAEIGALFVPVNTAFTAGEAEYLLCHSESSVLVTSRAFLPFIDQIRAGCPHLKKVIVLGQDEGADCLCWDEFFHGVSADAPGTEVRPGEIAGGNGL